MFTCFSCLKIVLLSSCCFMLFPIISAFYEIVVGCVFHSSWLFSVVLRFFLLSDVGFGHSALF